MTLAIPATATSSDRIRQQAAVLARPGLFERSLVVLTTFLFIHQTPDAWFRTRAEALDDPGNPLLVVLELGLTALAFARVAGSIDQLIAMVRIEAPVFLYAGLVFASTFWSASPGDTVKRALVFVAVTSFASYLVMRFSLDQIIRLLAVMFMISVAVNAAFVIALPQYGLDSGNNFTGVFSQKNALGYTAALGVPVLIVAGRSMRRGRGRVLFYATALAQIALLIGSQSKTMLVASLLPPLLMVVYHGFRGRKTLRGAVLVSLVGSSLFTVAFATANIGVLAQWLDKDVTLTGRIPLWQNLIPIVLESPILGHGYAAAFGGYFSPVHEVWIQNRWDPSHAHNALLQTWLEIGLVGVVLFLFIYLRAIVRAIHIVAIVPGAVGLWPLTFFTTALMISITESGVASNFLGWMMFVVAVLSVSLHLRYRTSIGLSNDLRAATEANARKLSVR
jgi:O-antigen ligase